MSYFFNNSNSLNKGNNKLCLKIMSYLLTAGILSSSLITKTNDNIYINNNDETTEFYESLLDEITPIELNEIRPFNLKIVTYSKDYEEAKEEVVNLLSNEEKIDIILEKYKITREEFYVIVAIICAECKYNNYIDSYAAINTLYNRFCSYKWMYSITRGYNKENVTLYDAITDPGQFSVYTRGTYKEYLNNPLENCLQAVIDMLYSENIIHTCTNFLDKSHNEDKNKIYFVLGGNSYYNELKEEDIIPVSERYFSNGENTLKYISLNS